MPIQPFYINDKKDWSRTGFALPEAGVNPGWYFFEIEPLTRPDGSLCEGTIAGPYTLMGDAWQAFNERSAMLDIPPVAWISGFDPKSGNAGYKTAGWYFMKTHENGMTIDELVGPYAIPRIANDAAIAYAKTLIRETPAETPDETDERVLAAACSEPPTAEGAERLLTEFREKEAAQQEIIPGSSMPYRSVEVVTMEEDEVFVPNYYRPNYNGDPKLLTYTTPTEKVTLAFPELYAKDGNAICNIPYVIEEFCENWDAMQIVVNAWANRKGWNEKTPPFAEEIANLQGELAEAWEHYRCRKPLDEVFFSEGELAGVNNKPDGVPVELADVLIRMLHVCARWNIPIMRAFIEKLAYNERRSYRHGNKAH